MTDERGGRYFREARFFLAGDKVAAQSHILEARSLMGYMRDMHALGGPPIQVQYATLQDGTRIKAVMMNGQYQAEIVSPARSDKDDGHLYRGFVLVLTEFDLSEAARETWSGAWDSAVLFGVVDGELRVREFAYPVASDPPAHLTYFVAPSRSGGEATDADEFHDVFTRRDATLFRNASIAAELPPGNGLPYIHPDDVTSIERVFDVSDSGMSAYALEDGGLLAQYVRGEFYQPLAPGWVYTSGVGLTDNVLSYVGTNVTLVGAVQVWSAKVEMLNAPPWLDVVEEFDQQGASGYLRSDTGWVASSTPAGAPPLVGPSDTRICDTWTGEADQWFFSGYVDSGQPKVTSGVSDTYDYNKTLGDDATITLADGGEIVSSRSTAIQNTLRVDAGVVVSGTWPHSDPLITDVFYDEATTVYLQRFLTIGGTPALEGDAVIGLSTQTVDSLSHTDVATSTAEHSALPHPLQATTSTTSHSAMYGSVVDRPVVPTTELGPINLGGGGGDYPTPTRVQNCTRTSASSVAIDTFSIAYHSTATARDYVYSDTAEDVFIWVEGTTVSDGSVAGYGSGTTGSHTVAVDVVVSVRGSEQRFPLFSKEIPTWAPHMRYTPDDVNFGTLSGGLHWNYASPQLPKPVYAPTWCAQGLCPHIAYTTKAEEAAGVTPHFALSLRLQCYLGKRSIFVADPEPPTPPSGTVQLTIPNIERVFEEWGVQVRPVFLGEYVAPGEPYVGGIEQKCVSVDFAIPGEVHYWIEDLGAPVSSLGTTLLEGVGSFNDPDRDYYPDRYNGQIYRT